MKISRLRITLTPFCFGLFEIGVLLALLMTFSRFLMCMIMNRLLRLLRMTNVIAIKSCGGFRQR
uniref:AV3 protein n=1 Tax=Malvastrum yellow vein Honghe virus TaxID=676044 RepID=A0A1B1X4A9_9GEMI|nr:AV3 protein [Malvastrum yellow vein Honghe virus]